MSNQQSKSIAPWLTVVLDGQSIIVDARTGKPIGYPKNFNPKRLRVGIAPFKDSGVAVGQGYRIQNKIRYVLPAFEQFKQFSLAAIEVNQYLAAKLEQDIKLAEMKLDSKDRTIEVVNQDRQRLIQRVLQYTELSRWGRLKLLFGRHPKWLKE